MNKSRVLGFALAAKCRVESRIGGRIDWPAASNRQPIPKYLRVAWLQSVSAVAVDELGKCEGGHAVLDRRLLIACSLAQLTTTCLRWQRMQLGLAWRAGSVCWLDLSVCSVWGCEPSCQAAPSHVGA